MGRGAADTDWSLPGVLGSCISVHCYQQNPDSHATSKVTGTALLFSYYPTLVGCCHTVGPVEVQRSSLWECGCEKVNSRWSSVWFPSPAWPPSAQPGSLEAVTRTVGFGDHEQTGSPLTDSPEASKDLDVLCLSRWLRVWVDCFHP